MTLQQQTHPREEKCKKDGVADRLIQISQQRELTAAEKLCLSDAVELALPVRTMPPVRRKDWYHADGR